MAIHSFKRAQFGGSMNWSVVCPFCQREPTHPILKSIPSETPQITLQSFIHHLSLAISLGMISQTYEQLSPNSFEQLIPEETREQWVSVIDSWLRESMDLEDVVNKDLSYCGCCVGWLRGMKWAYLLNLSITTKTTSFPCEFDNPSIKSILTSVQFYFGIGNVWSNLARWIFSTLLRWQTSHSLISFLTPFRILG